MKEILGLVVGVFLGILVVVIFYGSTPAALAGSGDYKMRKLEDKVKNLEEGTKRLRSDLKKMEKFLEDRKKDYEKQWKEHRRDYEKFQKEFKEHRHYLKMRTKYGSWQEDNYKPFEVEKKELEVGPIRK